MPPELLLFFIFHISNKSGRDTGWLKASLRGGGVGVGGGGLLDFTYIISMYEGMYLLSGNWE